MNFLSHHFFYSNQDSWHNTGLILPDWSRSAPGRRKLDWVSLKSDSDRQGALWLGCLKHYEADDWFHNCNYFKVITAIIEQDLAIMQLSGLLLQQRKWFLAHLLAEMLLDRLIIDKHSNALDHFYHDLSQVPYTDLELFLLRAGKETMGLFPQAHKGFIESEFIRYYKSSEGLTESLNRVVQRTRQAAFTSSEKEALIAIMDHWLLSASKIKKPLQMERL